MENLQSSLHRHGTQYLLWPEFDRIGETKRNRIRISAEQYDSDSSDILFAFGSVDILKLLGTTVTGLND